MEFLNNLLGLEETRLTAWHMALRAIIVFIAAIVYIRVAGVKTFGKQNIIDQITTLVLGTLLGNAIFTGTAPFFPILGAALVIMFMRRALSWLTFKSDAMGRIIKGKPLPLIINGEVVKKNMGKAFISHNDLVEALHLETQSNDIKDIEEGYLERSGHISFIKKDD